MSNDQPPERVSRGEMIALLRSIADAMESSEACDVRVGHQTIQVPGHADVDVRSARDGDHEEMEILLSWTAKQQSGARNLPAKAGIGLAIAAGAIAGGAAILQYIQMQKSSPQPAESDLQPIQQPDPGE